MKALIVEPSRLVSTMLANVMGKHGVEAFTVRTASEALAKLERHKFDLLCFAYVLGDMDGIAFIKAAKAGNLLGNQPVLMFSATHDKEHVDEALHAGVTECFSKHQIGEIDKFVGRFAANNELRIGGRVLLVEDSATAALFCVKTLVRMGLEVDHCKNAVDAVARFNTQVYDLVLTDYVLAGTETGMTVIRAVREARGRKARTPILAMSALNDVPRRIEILRSGANDFIGKPVVVEELEVRVYNLISMRKLMQQIEAQHEIMKDMALHDQLTSLYNRYYLHERLPGLIRKADAEGKPFSIAIVDIDHFKKVNDTHGHAIGDLVLVRVADEMREVTGAKNLLARFGGEEFVAVMLDTGLDEAVRWSEDLRARIADLKPGGIPVTASFGVATLGAGESYDELFRRADEAVYRAKASGRNRVEWSAAG
jgi:two-component system cell cycle response regulator